MQFREYLQEYRRFRAEAKEELGGVDEETIVRLFGLYHALKEPVVQPNPFVDLMRHLWERQENFDTDPDSDDNNDDLPPAFDPFDG